MDDPVPVSMELGESVASRLEGSTSLRALAREIGVHPTRLRRFLQGRRLYLRTRELLYAWWLRGGSVPPDTALQPEIAEAVAALVERVRPDRREGTRAALLDALRLLRDAHPERAPDWLAGVARTHGEARPLDSAAAGRGSAR